MSPRVSHLDNEQCRQCTSFADYMKANRKKLNDPNKIDEGLPEETTAGRRPDCPLDKDELGRKSWGLLHTIAAKYPQNPSTENKTEIVTFFNILSRLYPCDHCAEGLQEDLKNYPPRVNNQEELSQWLCELHNRVNLKIGKPIFDCTKVNQRWKDGWLDGSCD